MTGPQLVEDQRAQEPGICGVTTIGGTGIEWVCVRSVHAKVYQRRTGDRTHHRGEPIYQDGGKADQHVFVPRYPGRGIHPSLRDPDEDAYIGPGGSPLPRSPR
jgi:hypothetical protein